MMFILTQIERYFEFKTPLVRRNVIFITLAYLAAFYGIYLIPSGKLLTTIWAYCCATAGGISVSIGAHRLWTHRTYKAKLPMRVIAMLCYMLAAYCCATAGGISVSIGAHRLWTHRTYKAKLPMRVIAMLCYMLAGQYSIISWVRDHRTHHKYTDTDADPHNATRGLFFSHCGWLMMKRHPDVKEKGKVIDVSDVWQDPVIRFHQKYFAPLTLVMHVIFPSAIIYYVIGDTLKHAIFIGFFLRYMYILNIIWCTNSLSHYWGYKPYNKSIKATDSAPLACLLWGEGWHNFHHTFPWDYRIGEYGRRFQLCANIIEVCSLFGLAYDLKTASPELVQKVIDKQDLPKNYEVPEIGFTEDEIK